MDYQIAYGTGVDGLSVSAVTGYTYTFVRPVSKISVSPVGYDVVVGLNQTITDSETNSEVSINKGWPGFTALTTTQALAGGILVKANTTLEFLCRGDYPTGKHPISAIWILPCNLGDTPPTEVTVHVSVLGF